MRIPMTTSLSELQLAIVDAAMYFYFSSTDIIFFSLIRTNSSEVNFIMPF